MFPTQYPTNVKEEVSVRLVRPATFEGIRVQAKKSATTQGTVMKNLGIEPSLAQLLKYIHQKYNPFI